MKRWNMSAQQIESGAQDLIDETSAMYDRVASLEGDQVRHVCACVCWWIGGVR